MQLIGQSVKHKIFGNGAIIEVSDNIITVEFIQGEKKFIYPEAFMHFLMLSDKGIQDEISEVLNKKKRVEQDFRRYAQREQERIQKISTLKITPNSQGAFDLKSGSKAQVLSEWKVSTGCYLSGNSKGLPRIPNRLKPNSVCLLTECPQETPEKDRIIIGAFMVKNDFVGSLCNDGIIEGHERYRIALKEDQSLRFWDYFVKEDQVKRWGNTQFKYFSNEGAQRVLLDMIKPMCDSEDKIIANEFYQYFCKINRI
ncbi:MAG: hypothetical protein RR177_00430 [Oscillospiraceae bacterium]